MRTNTPDTPYGLMALAVGNLGGFSLPFCHWIVPAICYTTMVILGIIGLVRWRKELRDDLQ